MQRDIGPGRTGLGAGRGEFWRRKRKEQTSAVWASGEKFPTTGRLRVALKMDRRQVGLAFLLLTLAPAPLPTATTTTTTTPATAATTTTTTTTAARQKSLPADAKFQSHPDETAAHWLQPNRSSSALLGVTRSERSSPSGKSATNIKRPARSRLVISFAPEVPPFKSAGRGRLSLGADTLAGTAPAGNRQVLLDRSAALSLFEDRLGGHQQRRQRPGVAAWGRPLASRPLFARSPRAAFQVPLSFWLGRLSLSPPSFVYLAPARGPLPVCSPAAGRGPGTKPLIVVVCQSESGARQGA